MYNVGDTVIYCGARTSFHDKPARIIQINGTNVLLHIPSRFNKSREIVTKLKYIQPYSLLQDDFEDVVSTLPTTTSHRD